MQDEEHQKKKRKKNRKRHQFLQAMSWLPYKLNIKEIFAPKHNLEHLHCSASSAVS